MGRSKGTDRPRQVPRTPYTKKVSRWATHVLGLGIAPVVDRAPNAEGLKRMKGRLGETSELSQMGQVPIPPNISVGQGTILDIARMGV